jgi:hypothetical protein
MFLEGGKKFENVRQNPKESLFSAKDLFYRF